MPRVTTQKKSNRGQQIDCEKCRKPIWPGEEYYQWAFFRGRAHNQHVECGRPTRSQLTQSKLATVYDAQDSAQDEIAKLESPDEIAEQVRAVAESAREVAEEYRDAVEAMNMTGSGNESEERADQLEEYADQLEATADEIEGETNEDGDEPKDEFLERLRDDATSAIEDCPL